MINDAFWSMVDDLRDRGDTEEALSLYYIYIGGEVHFKAAGLLKIFEAHTVVQYQAWND